MERPQGRGLAWSGLGTEARRSGGGGQEDSRWVTGGQETWRTHGEEDAHLLVSSGYHNSL